MNETISEWMTETYDKTARRYRLADEVHVTGADHLQMKERLISLCTAFNRPISVLDLGCGTGRHFHCFRNVKHLVGVDISPEMLKEAENPVCASEIQVQKLELQRGDIYNATFESSSFDIIICFGVFGNGCAPSETLIRKLYGWLAEGGTLLFDVFDPRSLKPFLRFRKYVRWRLQALLPNALNRAWLRVSGWPPCYYCTFGGIWDLTKRAGISYVSLETVHCTLTHGQGAKFLVSAQKISTS